MLVFVEPDRILGVSSVLQNATSAAQKTFYSCNFFNRDDEARDKCLPLSAATCKAPLNKKVGETIFSNTDRTRFRYIC